MIIPAGVILIWTGLNSAIPIGWIRETALDGKYPKAWGVQDPNNTGGVNTHQHSSTAHGHNLNDHSHSVSLAEMPDHNNHACDAGGSGVSAHTHDATPIGNTSGGGLDTFGVTWSNVNHEPPFYSAIFIKPVIAVGTVAAGIVAHCNLGTLPNGWFYCDGNNGTPDLRSKYLKGANLGNDAGIQGGSLTHSHDVSHTHNVQGHTHSGQSPTWSNGHGDRQSFSNLQELAHTDHTHSISLNSTADTINSYSNSSAGNSDIVEPAYKKLGSIYNNGGIMTKGLIALWLGNISDVPHGWFVCDGNNGTPDLRDQFIKVSNDLTQNGSTGGANTHNHSTITHTHTEANPHTHSAPTSGVASTWGSINGGGGQGYNDWNHTHSIGSVGSASTTYTNANIDCSVVDNQPAYLTVAYIQFDHDIGGAILQAIQ